MKFIFNLYRASSKSKVVPKQKKLILNSNDRMHPQQKAEFVRKLRELSHDLVLTQVGGPTKVVKKITTKKGISKTRYLTQLVTPRYDKNKRCEATLTVFTPTQREGDTDNLQPTMKALMDGLTDANLWPDDNNKIVKFTKYQHGGISGHKGYRLEVDIDEAKES